MANDKNEKSVEEKLAGAQEVLNARAKEISELKSQLGERSTALSAANKEIDDLKTQVKALERDVKARDNEIAQIAASRPTSLKLDPNAPFIAKQRIRISKDVDIRVGERLTWDPKSPPEGFSGFVEGVHYERARAFIPAQPAA